MNRQIRGYQRVLLMKKLLQEYHMMLNHHEQMYQSNFRFSQRTCYTHTHARTIAYYYNALNLLLLPKSFGLAIMTVKKCHIT